MGSLLGLTIAVAAASSGTTQAQPGPVGQQAVMESDQGDQIVVEGQRLTAAALPNTTLIMDHERDNQIKIRIRADGTFVSYLRGLQSDFGKWRVERNTVCFDGRAGGSFCAPTLFGKHPGDVWQAVGLDGMKYKARLITGY